MASDEKAPVRRGFFVSCRQCLRSFESARSGRYACWGGCCLSAPCRPAQPTACMSARTIKGIAPSRMHRVTRVSSLDRSLSRSGPIRRLQHSSGRLRGVMHRPCRVRNAPTPEPGLGGMYHVAGRCSRARCSCSLACARVTRPPRPRVWRQACARPMPSSTSIAGPCHSATGSMATPASDHPAVRWPTRHRIDGRPVRQAVALFSRSHSTSADRRLMPSLS